MSCAFVVGLLARSRQLQARVDLRCQRRCGGTYRADLCAVALLQSPQSSACGGDCSPGRLGKAAVAGKCIANERCSCKPKPATSTGGGGRAPPPKWGRLWIFSTGRRSEPGKLRHVQHLFSPRLPRILQSCHRRDCTPCWPSLPKVSIHRRTARGGRAVQNPGNHLVRLSVAVRPWSITRSRGESSRHEYAFRVTGLAGEWLRPTANMPRKALLPLAYKSIVLSHLGLARLRTSAPRFSYGNEYFAFQYRHRRLSAIAASRCRAPTPLARDLAT